MFALIVERQIKLKIRVFLKINCHNICTYSSQNLSVNISHIRGIKALKQLIQVNCSFTSTFNNDYHYELPISALKKTVKQHQKTNYTEFSPYAKTIDNGNHNKNNNDNDIDNNNNYNHNNNNTNDRKLIKKKKERKTPPTTKVNRLEKKLYS